MSEGSTITIGLVITIMLALFSIYTFFTSVKNNAKQDQSERIKQNVKLDQLCNTSLETRADIKGVINDLKDVRENQIKNNIQIETMWKRIDDNKARIERLEQHIDLKD